jgi:glycosyltransferase involved in cell wall biosynthesis
MRIALYHNLHSGGARRVVESQIAGLAPTHTLALFGLARHEGAAPGGVVAYRPLPLPRSPLGRLGPLLRAVDLLRLDAASRRLAAMIDRGGYDVALVHPCQITQAPLLLRWLRTPALYFCHELPRQHYEPSPRRPYHQRSGWAAGVEQIDPLPRLYRALMRIVDRESALSAAMVAVNSRFSQGNIRAAYGCEVHVCYPGVDSSAFAPAPGCREPWVLSVGALTPLKGFDFVVEAIGTLPEAARPPLLIISNYQESRERAYLEALAAARGVRLELRTAVSDGDLQRAYASAGCVAYAPRQEPFGLVALEAMAAGAPLVAVAEGGVAETVIHGETGLVAPREPAAFGAALGGLVAAPERAEALGRAARRHVRDFWSWERHLSRLEEILALAASRGRAYASAA